MRSAASVAPAAREQQRRPRSDAGGERSTALQLVARYASARGATAHARQTPAPRRRGARRTSGSASRPCAAQAARASVERDGAGERSTARARRDGHGRARGGRRPWPRRRRQSMSGGPPRLARTAMPTLSAHARASSPRAAPAASRRDGGAHRRRGRAVPCLLDGQRRDAAARARCEEQRRQPKIAAVLAIKGNDPGAGAEPRARPTEIGRPVEHGQRVWQRGRQQLQHDGGDVVLACRAPRCAYTRASGK